LFVKTTGDKLLKQRLNIFLTTLDRSDTGTCKMLQVYIQEKMTKYNLMGYYATQTARSLLTLQRDTLHPSSELRVSHTRSQQAFCLLGLLFNPEDGSNTLQPIKIKLFIPTSLL
jgi:hypothetical protein